MGHKTRAFIGVVLSIALLWWALRDVSAAEVMHEIGAADPVLFTLSILATLGGFGFRALRWGVLLSPASPGVPFRPRFAATIVGFAANNLLPARVGEFARAYTLTRMADVRIGASLATLVIERILDGLVLVGLLFASMAAASFPVMGDVGGMDPRTAARAVAIIMGVLTFALFLMVLAPRSSVALAEAVSRRVLPDRFRRPVVAGVESFVAGLLALRDWRLFLVSGALALGQWLFTAISFLLAFRAFGIDDVPFAGAVFLQSLISLAVAIPSSPGFFGPFEAAAKIGLGVWGVSGAKAVSFAVGYHIGGFIPVTLMGIYYVWRDEITWREVQHSEEAVEAESEQEAEAGSRAAGRSDASSERPGGLR